MEIGNISYDARERGWMDTFFYPLAYVQEFKPCSWYDWDNFIWEGEKFHSAFSERVQWTKQSKVACRISFEVIDDLTDEQPRYYRVLTEFKTQKGAEAYKLRWDNGNQERF